MVVEHTHTHTHTHAHTHIHFNKRANQRFLSALFFSFEGIGPRVGWITVGGYVFFGAYEQALSLLWASGAWGKKPEWKQGE